MCCMHTISLVCKKQSGPRPTSFILPQIRPYFITYLLVLTLMLSREPRLRFFKPAASNPWPRDRMQPWIASNAAPQDRKTFNINGLIYIHELYYIFHMRPKTIPLQSTQPRQAKRLDNDVLNSSRYSGWKWICFQPLFLRSREM